jgi:hypothetical protein
MVWVAALVLCSSIAAEAAPPPHLPLTVTGDVHISTGTYRYVAVWNDAAGGYWFHPVGRPVAWTGDYLTLERDAQGHPTGSLAIDGATVDWSGGPLGRPLAVEGFTFSPVECDWGWGWDPVRTAEPLGWGLLTGMCWDLLIAVYEFAIGGFIRALKQTQ